MFFPAPGIIDGAGWLDIAKLSDVCALRAMADVILGKMGGDWMTKKIDWEQVVEEFPDIFCKDGQRLPTLGELLTLIRRIYIYIHTHICIHIYIYIVSFQLRHLYANQKPV